MVSFDQAPQLIQKILESKGIATFEEKQKVFSPSLKTELADPFILSDMSKAVSRLIVALENQEQVLIYGDFDLDGTPGVALLLDGFKQLGFKNLHYFQPKRLSDGYGLHKNKIEELIKEKEIQLVVTVDVGITGHEAVDSAQSRGVDVIITDHHLPHGELPKSFALVNPNSGVCHSGLGHLCGTGVAFYLVLALAKKLKEEKGEVAQDFQPKTLLDLFAIATLTDLVPLVKENRVLVKHGLVVLQNTKRVGLKTLLKELKLFGRPLSASDVAIRFAPKLNALSRMEEDLLPLDVFLVEEQVEAEAMVSTVLRLQKKRVNLQNTATEDVLDKRKRIEELPFVLESSQNYHKGVVGLVATKVSEEFDKPAFIGSENSKGLVSGSARLPKGMDLNLVEVLESSSKFLTKFGGHAQAAGFVLQNDKFDEFKNSLQRYFAEIGELPKQVKKPFDVISSDLREFNEVFMNWYDNLGPFGVSFEVPKLGLKNYVVQDLRWLKEEHLKLKLSSKNRGQVIDAIWFYADKASEELIGQTGAVLSVEPQWNYYNGKKTVQLLISGVENED